MHQRFCDGIPLSGFHFTEKGTDLWGGNTTAYPWYNQPQATMANEIAYPRGGLVTSTSGADLIAPVDASVNPPMPLNDRGPSNGMRTTVHAGNVKT